MKIANNGIIYETQEVAMARTAIKEALCILKSIRLDEGKVEAKDINMIESEIVSIADSLGLDRLSIRPV